MTVRGSEEAMGNKEAQAHLWTSPERRLWVGTLFMGCMVAYACRTVFPLTVPVMSAELGWSKSEAGTVLSAFFWGYAMTQVLGGYVSDRIGGATVLLTAAVGWAVLTFWTPRLVYLFPDKSTSLAFIVLSRVVVGALQGVHYPGVTSIIARKVSVEERALSYATATSGGHLGTLFCGSVGSLLLASHGWHIPFYFTGFLGMCWVLFLRYHVMSKQRKKEQLLGIGEDVKSNHTNTPVPWLTLFQKAPFWAVLIAHFCGNYSFFVLLSWLPTYFHEVYPEAKPWLYNVVPWLFRFCCVIGGGKLADYLVIKGYSVTFVRKLMNTVSQVGQAIFLILISYMQSFEGALFCMAGAMACGGFHNSGVLVNPQDIAPKYAGSVFGLMNTAGALPGFIGVYIAGHILEATKSWAAVFNLTSVIIFGGWTIFTCFGTGRQVV